MSHQVQLVSAAYLSSFHNDPRRRRSDCNHHAAKTMMRFTVLLTLGFLAGGVWLLSQN